MAGRRPKTSAERALHGNAGKRALPRDPKPALGWPAEPAGLSDIGHGEWLRLGGLLDGEKRLTISDGPMLEAAARAYAMYADLIRQIQDEQIPPRFVKVTVDGSGQEHREWKADPIYGMAKGWLEAYRHCVNDLGLSAGTRARVAVPVKEQDDPLAEFLGTSCTETARTRTH